MSNRGEEKGGRPPSRSKSPRYLQSILIKNDSLTFVDVDDIHWIEAAGNHVKLHCDGECYKIRGSLKNIGEKLDPENFVRIHKSSIINVSCVRFIQPCPSGDLKVKMQDGQKLNISRNYKKNLDKFKI